MKDAEDIQFARLPCVQGLYDPAYEHDSCGVGFVANVNGKKTHRIIQSGIEVLKNMQHRGAVGGDLQTGDGAGILLQVSDAFFQKEGARLDISLPTNGAYGVGMVFMPREPDSVRRCSQFLERTVETEGLQFLGWRNVPVDSACLAGVAKDQEPIIMQCFIGSRGLNPEMLDRRLYVIRRQVENKIKEGGGDDTSFYIPSMSSRTIVYKGLLIGERLPVFYKDLDDPNLVSAVAVVHQRYSTNTFPSWELSQPFRYLAHNGEINTLRGNLNLIRSRESSLRSDFFGEDIKKVLPVIDERGSDSACLDNTLQLLVNGGRSLEHAMLMLVPEAWGVKYPMGPDQRGFFEYHAGLMEPWDGPAAIAFSDGTKVGAMVDRNGLRPARYTITKKGFMVFASEAGVLDIPASKVAEKGALRPGQMILVDFKKKRVLKNQEIKALCARRQPYRRWVEENKITLRGFYGDVASIQPDLKQLKIRQRLFGYTREDLRLIIDPMASKGQEPIGAMGADVPLAVFSERPQLLYSYFKQLFAQVTNPPIDPVREELVMSLMTFIGNPGNILSEIPQNSRLIKLRHPILANEDLRRIKELNIEGFRSKTLQMGFMYGDGGKVLEGAVERLCEDCESALAEGSAMLILSDRNLPEGMIPMPALLAVSAVNQRLIRQGVRTQAGLIVETGEAKEVMDMALLLGYGATAVNPYLAFETIAGMVLKKELSSGLSIAVALENYIKALCKGLLKIMSKMGISTLRSYRSAQVFEAIGLNSDLVNKYFIGTSSRIEGIGLKEVAEEARGRHHWAFRTKSNETTVLPSGGFYRYRQDGERHLWTPEAISLLQWATRNKDMDQYRKFAQMINDQAKRLSTLRGMFVIKKGPSIPIEEVESAARVIRRFVTGAMSFGSISKEAHETIAIAMNRLKAKSNSGEGGEDPARYKRLPNGDNRCSAIKQVASGRFGVTTDYLVNATELQIKIAQGAKPGEGGQLPGHKVNVEIARVRHSTPGVTLISPPPHHDIYSIEDLSQLIFDLRNVNPKARISVKLVSEIGVGTIAAGVSKAHADLVLISGYDGGTGASPLSSIRHAGVPWELGLAEAQQTLVLNNLRGQIRIQVDGQIKTGRDVIIAALLGAEEFGFATAVLIVLGCVMMRKCNNNTCPVGIATQLPELRRFFDGRPEYIENYFLMVAEEIRAYMAEMGFRTMDELIGRSDLLEMAEALDFWKAKGLDFSKIFYRPKTGTEISSRERDSRPHDVGEVVDRQLIAQAKDALEMKKPVVMDFHIQNINRAVGAMLSGEIARRYGSRGLPDDTITCNFHGAAGQSFGAFAAKGLTLVLNGESNDYLGKGLSGGKIIVKPYEGVDFDPSENIIVGNVLLYGATAGEVYILGKAGERFAIRNSGATAVVEGVGDHACEYMTGGCIVVLGCTGINFAAGMSGGVAYVYDPTQRFDSCCNLDMVDLELIVETQDIEELKKLISNHLIHTGSRRAAEILDNWEATLPFFVKVFPMEYRRVLGKMTKEDEATAREEVQHG